MRTTRRCDSLRLNVGPNEPPKPSRAKQGTQFPPVILAPSGLRGKRCVKKALEGFGALGERAAPRLLRILATKQLVGDVQRRKHCEAERISGWRRFRGGAHPLIDVRREAVHVSRVERAADRIPLSANLDRHNLRFSHYTLSPSSCSSMSDTRPRIVSRSIRS